jgi:hypothetical protein
MGQIETHHTLAGRSAQTQQASLADNPRMPPVLWTNAARCDGSFEAALERGGVVYSHRTVG